MAESPRTAYARWAYVGTAIPNVAMAGAITRSTRSGTCGKVRRPRLHTVPVADPQETSV